MSNHFEGLGKTWLTLLNDPEKEVPAVVMQVMKEGKTRDCWQRKDSKEETMVLAWPVETAFRAGVTIHGKAGEQLRPVSTYPLLEGAPNDMTVNETYFWQNETEGEVSATCNEGANPLWFYSPFLFRDRENLTPGVRHTFLIAGLAYGLRKRAGYGMRGQAHGHAARASGEDVRDAEARREDDRERAGPEAFQERHKPVVNLGDHIKLLPVAQNQGQGADCGAVLGPVNPCGGVGVEGTAAECEKGFRWEDDGMPIKHELRRAL